MGEWDDRRGGGEMMWVDGGRSVFGEEGLVDG